MVKALWSAEGRGGSMPDQNQRDAEATSRANSNYKKLAVLLGVPAAASLMVYVPQHEGIVYHGYKDAVGVPTKCMGDTHNVVVGQQYSKAECYDSLTTQLLAHAQPVIMCVPQLKGDAPATIASVDLAYNIGVRGFCKSTAAAKFRAGDRTGGCKSLGVFTKAGGRVLPGLVKRREWEVHGCLTGRF